MGNVPPDMQSLLDAALEFAQRGWPVFPCGPDKVPLLKGGFKSATTDQDQIKQWWLKWPNAMIGLATGTASGIAVLDLDCKNDVDGFAWLRAQQASGNLMPDTVEVTTPSGGRHFYFRHRPGWKCSVGKIAPGVDVRAEGGYVTVPPSGSSNGQYAWKNPPSSFEVADAPDWLANLLDDISGHTQPAIHPERGSIAKLTLVRKFDDSSKPEDVERALNGWWNPDSYGDWITAALALHSFPGGKDIWLDWSARSSKFNAADNQEKWADTVPTSSISPRTILARVPKETLSQWAKERTVSAGHKMALLCGDQSARGVGDEWRDCLLRGKNDVVRSNHANLLTVLRHHEAWRDVVSFNEFNGKLLLIQPVPRHDGQRPNNFEPREWHDKDTLAATEWFQLDDFPSVTPEKVYQAIQQWADQHCSCHPLRDYLSSLAWDGTRRLDSFLATYLGAEVDKEQSLANYIESIGAKWLISAVARVFKPGCKADHVLVLEGDQGAGKSTALATLAGEWFSDNLPGDLQSKDAADHLRGKWIIELAELSQMNRSEIEAVKAFITRTEERFRPAYGRCEVTYPRQCIFAGSTNASNYLRDETGGRRFWPMKVGNIDLEALSRDRDQLWAEAVHLYKAGEKWWLDSEEVISVAQREQRGRLEEDPWTSQVEDYLANRNKVTIREIFVHVLEIDVSKQGKPDSNRIARILTSIGFANKTDGKKRYWVRKGEHLGFG